LRNNRRVNEKRRWKNNAIIVRIFGPIGATNTVVEFNVNDTVVDGTVSTTIVEPIEDIEIDDFKNVNPIKPKITKKII
jgi:hypothetical protein